MHCIVIMIIAIIASAHATHISVRRLPFFPEYSQYVPPLVDATTNVSISILSDLSNPSSLLTSRSSPNVFFSPLGVASTLAVMRLCSSGQTRKEFDRLSLFRLPGGVVNSFNVLNHFLFESSIVPCQHQHTELDSSNLLFLERSLVPSELFKYRVRSFDKLDVLSANFSGDASNTLKQMNEMISTKTRGLIPNMFSSADVTSETQLVISNTVYFKGLWKRRFIRARRALEYFHLENGSTVPVPMMTKTNKYANHILCRTEGNDTECGNSSIPDLIEIPFEGDNRRMVIILPNQRVNSLDEIKRRFVAEIEKWRGAARKTSVTLTMPRFTLDYEVDLKHVLANQGLRNVFDSSSVDFSDLSSTPLRLTKFVHKTSIRVGQNGVTLASGSGVIAFIRKIFPDNDQNRMVVNRPFLFFIEDIPTKMLVFLGEVTDPR